MTGERTILAELTTSLNALSGLCLLIGLYFIVVKRDRRRHTTAMLTAFGLSALFLVVYLLRVYLEGTHRFPGTGTIRTVYLTVLTTHTILAAVLLPMAIITVVRALRRNFRGHVRIARWTVPIWLYVSATGPIIYYLLYRYPHP